MYKVRIIGQFRIYTPANGRAIRDGGEFEKEISMPVPPQQGLSIGVSIGGESKSLYGEHVYWDEVLDGFVFHFGNDPILTDEKYAKLKADASWKQTKS